LARGPKIGAYLKDAEIARLPADRSQGQLADTLRVPIDSTYLLERDRTGRYIGPVGLPFPSGGAPEVALQPYDEILILKQPDFELQRTVQVRGEVRFPGTRSEERRVGKGGSPGCRPSCALVLLGECSLWERSLRAPSQPVQLCEV